jgi:hypothetical protein
MEKTKHIIYILSAKSRNYSYSFIIHIQNQIIHIQGFSPFLLMNFGGLGFWNTKNMKYEYLRVSRNNKKIVTHARNVFLNILMKNEKMRKENVSREDNIIISHIYLFILFILFILIIFKTEDESGFQWNMNPKKNMNRGILYENG